MTQPTADLLADLLAAYNSHDADRVIAFFTPDAVFEAPAGPGPGGVVFQGHEAIRAAVQKRFDASPDVAWTDDSHGVSGSSGYSEWTVSWTEDGAEVRKRGCDIYRFSGGKVARKDSFFKTITP
jgi:ketosteroid isomerase-like protein